MMTTTKLQPTTAPESAEAVQQLLVNGNAAFAAGRPDTGAPAQRPFAAVLGCSDARAPLEMLFGRGDNEMFVVRVAGNVLGEECLGSIDYAVGYLPSLRLVAVVGHTGCGAVTAAVDAFLAPAGLFDLAANRPLHALVARLLPAVRAADDALRQVYGQSVATRCDYRAALVDLAVTLNAALVAATLRRAYPAPLGVVYGVYDLAGHLVSVPDGERRRPGLAAPPADAAAYDALALALARRAQFDGNRSGQ